MKLTRSPIIDTISDDNSLQSQPIYLQICHRIRRCVSEGLLKPGERIPSSRTLANELSVARGTVDAAYNLLISEGLLESRGQAGTIISPDLEGRNVSLLNTTQYHETQSNDPAGQFVKNPPFQMGLPALDSVPRKIWSRLGAKTLRAMKDDDFAYPLPQGELFLREKIATYLQVSRGFQCAPEQIFITSGYRTSLEQVVKCLSTSELGIHVEDPCFIHTTEVLNRLDTKLMPLAVDEHGLTTAQLSDNAKCVIVTPAHQSPLCVTLSLTRRLELLEWAAGADDRYIVEDDYDGEFHYASKPVPAMKSLDSHDNVIYLGTFSKVLFPGIRLSYVVVPEALVQNFTQINATFYSGCDVFTQQLLAQFIHEGHFIRHIQAMRKLYKERYLMLEQALKTALADMNIEVLPNYGGMHLLIKLNDDLNQHDIKRNLERQGLAAQVMADWQVEHTSFSALMLGFTNVSTKKMAKELATQVAEVFACV